MISSSRPPDRLSRVEVVLECPNRIEQTERGHRGEQADLRRSCSDVAQHHRWRRRDEGILVAFADREAVEAEFLGEYGVVDDLAQALGGALLLTGHRVRMVCDERQ
jgi:hypothetical protein